MSAPQPPARPAVKAVYAPLDVATGTVSLGIPRTPLSAHLPDPDGWVRAVLHTLDGRYTLDEVVARFAGSLSPSDIRAMVDTLAADGFLEDAAAPTPTGLTDAELVRYDRNAEFFSYFSDRRPGGFEGAAPATTRWTPQLTLKDASVVVVGLGGFGSHLALHLASLGVGHLTLVDDDTVEAANLNRHVLARDTDIGRLKVDAAAEKLRALNPLVDITTSAVRVTGPADVEGWMLGSDLVVCAADRPRVDIDGWFNAAALRSGTPWLRGATVGLSAVVDLFVPGRTACAQCRLQPGDGDTNARMVEQLRVDARRGTSPVVSPVAGLLGSLAALETTKFLTGVAPTPLLEHQLVVDLLTSEVHHVLDRRVEGCTACSGTS